MKGLDEFLKLFGDITLLDVIEFGLAITFVILVYKKYKQHMSEKFESEKRAAEKEAQREKEHKELMDSMNKYPEYRKQSIKVQELLESEISEIKAMCENNSQRLLAIEEKNKLRECNKLRDTLLQNYRWYTNKDCNPSGSWTRMEADAFWALFRDYEDMDGNGHMHSVVRPAMEALTVIEH